MSVKDGAGLLKHAFDMARQGHDLDQIERELKKQGYEQVHAHLCVAGLRSQLRQLIASAKKQPGGA